MNFEVVLTCAVTGAGDTVGKSNKVPITAKEIADEALKSAKAGATSVHLHVRDPKSGNGSRDPKLFKEVVDRIRNSSEDVIINLTAGMGGDWVVNDNDLNRPGIGTDMISAEERLVHVKECLPEICSLDCGTMNFGNGNEIYISTPPFLRQMAALTQKWGVKPELEVFDLGHIRFAKEMLKEGLIDQPPLFQICLGIPWGAEQTVDTMKVMKDHLPSDCYWASFGISRMQMPILAASVAMGGNVRVGLEDNLYLQKVVLASNADLVLRAKAIIELMGARILSPQEARTKFNLKKQIT